MSTMRERAEAWLRERAIYGYVDDLVALMRAEVQAEREAVVVDLRRRSDWGRIHGLWNYANRINSGAHRNPDPLKEGE